MSERCAIALARLITLPIPFRDLRRRLRDSVRHALWCPPHPGDGVWRRDFQRKFAVSENVPEKVALPTCDNPLVSIVIPVYNNFRLTMLCLDSIARNTGDVPYEVILADDASTDETARIADRVTGLRIVRSPGNLRFLRNCNAAARSAIGKYVLFLNNDTQVLPGWLEPLCERMERDAGTGLVGSMLLNPDGSVQEIGMTFDSDATATANGGRHPAPWRRAFRGAREVDYVSGASMMLRRDLWERIGGFDERYAPAYFEDADLAYRIRAGGLRVVCEPASKVVHCCGATSGQREAFEVNREKFRSRWLADRGSASRTPHAVPDWSVWLFALIAASFLSVIYVFFLPGYNYDVLMRYAPMADEFAAGNWYYAFHPKYCVFMSAAAGSLAWLTGVSGETACKLVATFAWCFSAVPLWHFVRRSFGREAAWVSAALLLVVPEYADYASAGLRDGVRILSYALIGYGFLHSPRALAAGLFVQMTLRMDGVVVGGAAYLAYLAACAFRRRLADAAWPTFATALALLLDCTMVHCYTGHFLPSSSFIGILGRWL